MGILEATRPFTSSGHVFFLDAHQLSAAMKSFLAGIYVKGAEVHEPAPVAVTLPHAMEYLAHAVDGQFPTRLLLLQTRTFRTTVFNNAWRSRGWFEMAFVLTKRLQAEDVYFLSQPNTIRRVDGQLRGQYGGIQLIRLVSGEVVRSVSLVNDGGRWVFTTRGEPAPFERLEQYQAARKSDRFTPALLEEYLGSMDLCPFQDGFFVVDDEHPATGIEITMSPAQQAAHFPPLSLEEIRGRYGPFV